MIKLVTYTKLMDDEGNEQFVRTNDFKKYRLLLKENADPKKVVAQMLKMICNSPDGMTKLNNGIKIYNNIMEIKSISMLKNLKSIIDHKIQLLKNKKRSDKQWQIMK